MKLSFCKVLDMKCFNEKVNCCRGCLTKKRIIFNEEGYFENNDVFEYSTGQSIGFFAV